MNTKSEYFTRFPNDYVQGNIKTKYVENFTLRIFS